MSKSISAALLGLGTVGYGVRRLLEENRGINIEIKKILVRQPEKHGDIDPGLLTTDLDGIISDPGIELVIEAMGAGAFGYAAIRRSLVSGKSVITADKEIVARHLPELSTLAEARDARFYFEAAAGGAVPVIRNLLAIRKYDRVESVAGIVNGTANYILTQMFRRDIDFASALAAAREAGFAEADPEDDVSGIDSARKIAILAALAYDVFVPSEHIYRYGIANITKEDIAF
ncbi:MAG: homoserine dehydrogenase, partial [Bacilli bacterium]